MTLSTAQTNEAEVTPSDFEYLQDLLRRKAGIELAERQIYLAETRLPPVARAYQMASISEVIAKLKAGTNRELETDVVDAFTTNETSFFRDHHPFEDLTRHIIPELLKNRSATDQITIWCAASSSGQEPYTLAMILAETFPELVTSRRARIIATDLSRTMVSRTEEGRYTQLEVNRGLPAKLLLKYFDQAGRDWVAKPQLRNMIQTRTINLLEDWPGVPRSDIVMLRNVLIYFSTETRVDILRRIGSNVLKPDGFLFLGSSETVLRVGIPFKTRRFDGGSCCEPETG